MKGSGCDGEGQIVALGREKLAFHLPLVVRKSLAEEDGVTQGRGKRRVSAFLICAN